MLSPLAVSDGGKSSIDDEFESALQVWDKVEPILAHGVFLSPFMISNQYLDEMVRKRTTLRATVNEFGQNVLMISGGQDTYVIGEGEVNEMGDKGNEQEITKWDVTNIETPKRLTAVQMAHIVKYFVQGARLFFEENITLRYAAETVLSRIFKYFSEHPERDLNPLYTEMVLYFLSMRYTSIVDIMRGKSHTLALALIIMEFWEGYNQLYDDKSRKRRDVYISSEDANVAYAQKTPLFFREPKKKKSVVSSKVAMQFFTYDSDTPPTKTGKFRYKHVDAPLKGGVSGMGAQDGEKASILAVSQKNKDIIQTRARSTSGPSQMK